MSRSAPDELAKAFERAALVRGPGDPALSDAAVRRARRILDARRAFREAERCPTAVVRRVEGWFGARPRGALARVLDLVLDSGVSPLPAVRGLLRAPRLLRCAGGGATVDLQVESSARARVVRLAVRPAVPGLMAEVRGQPGGAPRRVRLDAEGTGDVRLPARSTRLRAVFRVGGTESFRIGTVRLD